MRNMVFAVGIPRLQAGEDVKRNWSDHMLLTRMSVEPFAGELAYQRLIGESFPNDVYKEIN